MDNARIAVSTPDKEIEVIVDLEGYHFHFVVRSVRGLRHAEHFDEACGAIVELWRRGYQEAEDLIRTAVSRLIESTEVGHAA